jgi:hypothetical protein
MLDIVADHYIWVGSILRHLLKSLESPVDEAGTPINTTDEIPMSLRAYTATSLIEVAERCEPLELLVAKRTVEYWTKQFSDTERTMMCAQGVIAIEEIERTLRNEAETTTLFYVPRERTAEFLRMWQALMPLMDKPWGVALDNLQDARFCYLYDACTASVFHSMRAAEKILTVLARSLGEEAAREQWQTLIERIEAKIKNLDGLPKGAEKERKQASYSEMAMQLRYIKNAWRNHVMHARVDYGEKQAREIWWHIERTLEHASVEFEEEVGS